MGSDSSGVLVLKAQGFQVMDLWLLWIIKALLNHQRGQVPAASAVREAIREQLCDCNVRGNVKSPNVGLAKVKKIYSRVASECLYDLHAQKNTRHGHMEGRVRTASACFPCFSYPERFPLRLWEQRI